jgi:hypothetical protein
MGETATSSTNTQKSDKTSSSEDLAGSSSQWSANSSRVHLARSKQTWTGAGNAAGYVLRYLVPMRRLMLDVVGSATEGDRALAILVAHLVKAGFNGNDKGRLRDFLIRGIRSAAKARFDELKQSIESGATLDGKPIPTPDPPRVELAQLDSGDWVGYWREGLLQRAWRSLERYQHAVRYGRVATSEVIPEGAPVEDLIHDALRVSMAYPSETVEKWASRVSSMAGRTVTAEEIRSQIELARVRFAQQIADEVAQTLEQPDPKAIHAEIKTLGLTKAFAGVKVLA